MSKNTITVTQPYLPPLEEFIPFLEKIWDTKWLTNNGPFHQQFERRLCEYLGVEHLTLFTNATIALVTALRALRISGEVITTPYSFVATTHSLAWNDIQPVFVDIESDTPNLDPGKIEANISEKTRAIMPVHCYGYPCNIEEIQRIAYNYGLPVIYDAAHAFGVNRHGHSLLKHGDLSVLSFHATKVFTTFEGGAIICPDAKTKQRIDYLKNFGIADEVTVVATGINGKMSEIQAAFGLLQLEHIDHAIQKRKNIDSYYRERLANVLGITLLQPPLDTVHNYSYFPVLVETEYPIDRDGLYEKLREAGIYARRYFYPLISNMPMYCDLPSANSVNLPVAESIANRILCLPIHPGLSEQDQDRVIQIIRGRIRDVILYKR